MSNPNLTEEIQTDIENFLEESRSNITNYCDKVEHSSIPAESLKIELEECLEQYCDDNNLSLDIQKTVEDFLTKRGEK
jgi:hypothetical protein